MSTSCDQSGQSDHIWVVGVAADNPPFVFVDTQKDASIKGFEPELIMALAKEAGKQVEFRDMEFGGLIASLQTGRVDMAISSMEVTLDRQKSVDFSITYQDAATVLVSQKREPLTGDIAWNGLKIGVQLGSAHEGYVKLKAIRYNDLKRVSYNRVNEMVQDLENGRLDGFLTEKPVGDRLAKRHTFEVQSLPDLGKAYGIAFPKGSALVQEVNAALERLRTSGKLEALAIKWGV